MTLSDPLTVSRLLSSGLHGLDPYTRPALAHGSARMAAATIGLQPLFVRWPPVQVHHGEPGTPPPPQVIRIRQDVRRASHVIPAGRSLTAEQ